jgi:RHS repeat-associated protein
MSRRTLLLLLALTTAGLAGLLVTPDAVTAQACSGPYCVTVTPNGGSKTHAANTSGHSATFTVQNTGTATDDYLLGCSSTGPVSCGTVTPSAPTVGANQSVQVTVSYSVGSSGSGTLRLTAWSGNDFMVSDEGYYNVTVTAPPAEPTVTPNGSTTPDRQTGTGGYSASFTVKNTGGSTGTFNLSCSNSGPNVTCTGLSQSSVNLGPNASQAITAYYGVGGVGVGTLQLDATIGGLVDFGWYDVPVHSYGVSVTPNSGTTPVRQANTGGYSTTFTVQNTGSKSATFSFTRSCSGGVSCGSAPGNVTLNAGAQTTVNQSYSVGSPGTGSITLTANGTNATNNGSYSVPIVSYGVEVTPNSGTTPTRQANTGGHSATFTVKNTGSAQATFSFTRSCSGGVSCGSAPGNVTLNAGAQTTVNQSYSVGSPGTGSITLTANGTNATNNGSYSVPIVSYGVEVTPNSGTTPTRQANTGGHSATFTVKNTGSAQATFSFTRSCSGGVTCGSAPGNVTLNAGAQTTVSQSYSVGSPGTGSITLTANGTNATNNGSYSVPIVSYGVEVTPNSGTTPTRQANTGGHSATFTVKNTGSAQATFSFTRSCSGGVTCGTAPGNVTLNAGAQTTVNQSYSVGSPGTGTITLTANGTNASDNGSYSVPIVSYGVEVTPNSGTTPTRQANTGGHSATFTVKNTGSAQATFSFTRSCSGGVTCGTAPGNVTLNAGAQTTVSQSYSVGSPGTGTITLTANGTNASDNGSYSVPIVSYGVEVTPNSGTTPTRQANTGGHSATFTVKNTGSAQATFSFTRSCSGGVTCGSAPGNVTLNAGAQTTVNQSYSVGSPGTGSITLTANGTNASDNGSYSVPIVSYGVEVTPNSGTTPTRQANTGGHSATFTVKNTGSAQATFSFTRSCSGGVSCGSAPGNVTLNAGAQTTVSQSYSVGSPGTGSITLTANGTNASDNGSYSVPIVSYGVEVTPNSGTAPVRIEDTDGHSETFTVQNTGSAQATFSFTRSCSNGVTCGSAPGNVTLNAGAQTTVSQTYSVGSPGEGTITLTATGTNAQDSGSYTIPIEPVYVAASVVNGNFVIASQYVLQETAVTYDAVGRITELTDARGATTLYQYGGPNNAYLTNVTRVADATGTVNLTTALTYDARGQVEALTDEGGTTRRFSYDGFGRLAEVRNHADELVEAYAYHYSRTSGNNWTFDPQEPNRVETTTYLAHVPSTQSVTTREWLDGLGRPIQTHVQDSVSRYVVTATEYDGMGREWRNWNPYYRTGTSYDGSFSANAAAHYNAYPNLSSTTPYRELEYTPDPLSRMKRESAPHSASTDPAVTEHAYGVEAATSRSWTEEIDALGNRTRRYTDAFGHEVEIVLGYGSPDATTTLLEYDALGRRVKATDPRGLETTYLVSTRGLLRERTSPDAGTVRWKYDRAGELRYRQDATQAAADPERVWFQTYDFAGRPLVEGEAAAAFSGLDPDQVATFEGQDANWLVVHAWDEKPSTGGAPWSLFSSEIGGVTLSNTTGRLAAVASRSAGAWQVTLYSYDQEGRVERTHTFTENMGGTGVIAAASQTVEYERDLRGEPVERRLTVGALTFNHWYEYTGRGLLARAYASTSSGKPSTPDAAYSYRPSGAVASRQFLGGSEVPLLYTVREELETIGNPGTTAHPFAARYTYHLNGWVSESEFYNAGAPGGGAATANRYRYVYGAGQYDALGRLLGATYQGWTGSWSSTLAHNLTGITYDPSGNITAMRRYREDGTLIDDLTYSYPGSSNRLSSVTDAVAATLGWDAQSGSFSYDANGNMTSSPAPYSVTGAAYDHRNLPTSLTSGSTTTVYRYDHAGQRTHKRVGSGNTEIYLLEGTVTLGVVTVDGSGAVVSSTFNVVADGQVIGRQETGGARLHYHRDLLGSTRAVVQGSTVVESYDYDPWGVLMPGRALLGTTKEGFTRKERDGETGLDYFGFRYYMAALGRWAAVDPLVDDFPSWSPYTYALNHPVGLVDPDGRCSRPAGVEGRRVGICIGVFIAAPRIGGVGLGDNRGPVGDDPNATYRAQVQIVFDPGTGSLDAVVTDAGVSSVLFKGLGRKGTATSRVSRPRVDEGGTAHFRVSLTATNGLAFLPFAPKETIDMVMGLMVTSDGRVGISGGMRDGYPSLEVFAYDGEGNMRKVIFLPETDPEALRPPRDQRIPRVDPIP